MSFVVTRADPLVKERVLYYAGYQTESFSDSGPIWLQTSRSKNARFDETTADMIIKQLTAMGHQVEKRPLGERKRRGK